MRLVPSTELIVKHMYGKTGMSSFSSISGLNFVVSSNP